MPDMKERLSKCFLAVFPGLTERQLNAANPRTIATWDSVAHLSLLTLIDEEFALGLDYEEYEAFDSYSSILAFLNERAKQV